MKLDYSVNINGGCFERVEDALSAVSNSLSNTDGSIQYLQNRLESRLNQLETDLNTAKELITQHRIFKEKLLIAIEANRPYQDFLKILNEI